MFYIAIVRKLRNITGSGSGKINADRPVNFITGGTNIGNADMPLVDFVNRIAFDSYDPVINSFTGGISLERGEETLIRTLSYSFTSPTGGTVASAIITRTGGSAINLNKSGTGTFTGTQAVTLTANTNETFTLTVTSGDGKTATSSTTFTFLRRLWYGVAADPGTYDEAFIKALASSSLDANYMTTFEVTAGSGLYIYFACPKSYLASPYIDPPYFFLGTTLPGGAQIEDTAVSYTYGTHTEDYVVFRSANASLGLCEVTISNSST